MTVFGEEGFALFNLAAELGVPFEYLRQMKTEIVLNEFPNDRDFKVYSVKIDGRISQHAIANYGLNGYGVWIDFRGQTPKQL